jgi:midasin
LKQWVSRLKSIRDEGVGGEQEDDSTPTEDQDENMMDYEHVSDPNAASDAQALDIATADQAAEMKAPETTENEEDGQAIDDSMDIDQKEEEDETAEEKETRDMSGSMRRLLDRMETDAGEEEDEEGAGNGDAEMEDKSIMDTQVNDGRGEDKNSRRPDVEDIPSEDPLEEVDYEGLVTRMNAWHQAKQDPEKLLESRALWSKCVNATQSLSFILAEQLRLILTPTLATRLAGDYKTGKRLNMRRVISYIASDYKKDKIWLRRTKPSKRTYQIMLAIDDSESMMQKGCALLAYQSLALISKALSTLEAGQLSLVRFGQDVEIVHPFEKEWSDAAGAESFSRFTFAQRETRVDTLMSSGRAIFNNTVRSGGDAGLWKLKIILSDGVCTDHAKLRAQCVGMANDDRIMCVFVVLDGGKDSIMDMKKVEWLDGGGRLEMTRYMDTFPFDYFVGVREIGRLPSVLSDVLRQYFALVAGQ